MELTFLQILTSSSPSHQTTPHHSLSLALDKATAEAYLRQGLHHHHHLLFPYTLYDEPQISTFTVTVTTIFTTIGKNKGLKKRSKQGSSLSGHSSIFHSSL